MAASKTLLSRVKKPVKSEECNPFPSLLTGFQPRRGLSGFHPRVEPFEELAVQGREGAFRQLRRVVAEVPREVRGDGRADLLRIPARLLLPGGYGFRGGIFDGFH